MKENNGNKLPYNIMCHVTVLNVLNYQFTAAFRLLYSVFGCKNISAFRKRNITKFNLTKLNLNITT